MIGFENADTVMRTVMCQRFSRHAHVARLLEPELLPVQRPQHFPFPPRFDRLDGSGREVRWRPVLQARAQDRVHMRMRSTAFTSVLVDRERTLDTSRGAAEGLLHRVAEDALRQAAVEAREAFGRFVVDGEDEAEVHGVAKTAAVLQESASDCPFVSAEGAVAVADAEQFSPFSSLLVPPHGARYTGPARRLAVGLWW